MHDMQYHKINQQGYNPMIAEDLPRAHKKFCARLRAFVISCAQKGPKISLRAQRILQHTIFPWRVNGFVRVHWGVYSIFYFQIKKSCARWTIFLPKNLLRARAILCKCPALPCAFLLLLLLWVGLRSNMVASSRITMFVRWQKQ